MQGTNHISRCFYGAMTLWLRRWILKLGVSFPKPLDRSKVDSAFHPSKVDQMSINNFWELSGKRYTGEGS